MYFITIERDQTVLLFIKKKYHIERAIIMDNTRRKEIKKVITVLETLYATIENLQEEEEESMFAIEENFSGTDRYARMEECYDLLGDAISSIEETISSLESCVE